MTAAYPTVTYVDETKSKELFLKFAHVFMTGERFKDLSNGAKILYSFLYNRCIYSAANGFIENEHAYAICRREQLCVVLGCSDNKAGKLMNELKTAGLIEVRRPGQGKPNRIFVKNYAVPELPYLDGTEGITGNFYRLPWSLITSYGSMSDNAKLLYMLLLDKSDFSKANHWVDNEGKYFVYYSLDKIMQMLNISRKTAVKAINELINAELIETVRQGQGKPNRIYICGHEFSTNEKCANYTSEMQYGSEVEKTRNMECKNCGSMSAENAEQGVQESRFPIDNKNQINRTCELDHSYQDPNAENTEEQKSLLDYEYIIRGNISENDISMKKEDIEEIAELTAQTIVRCDTQRTVCIGRTEYNSELLKRRLLSLDGDDIKEFRHRVCDVRARNIRNRRAYIMTVLADITAAKSSKGIFEENYNSYSAENAKNWQEYFEYVEKCMDEGNFSMVFDD